MSGMEYNDRVQVESMNKSSTYVAQNLHFISVMYQVEGLSPKVGGVLGLGYSNDSDS